jgi:predicted amidohydrolase YtcJ
MLAAAPLAAQQRTGPGPASRPATAPAPDLLLVNGRIHTMDAAGTVVRSVTIRNGRFAAVGTTPAAVRTPGIQTIDLRGRTVVPGLIETHLHGLDTADRVGHHALDVESAASIREVQDILAVHRKTVEQDQWLTAIGAAHPNLWVERRFPTLRELDDAVPDRPVFLYQGFNGPAVTNTLGKRFFDAADAVVPAPHPDYVRVNVSDTGAIAASNPQTGGPATSALYLLRRLQTFEDKRQNALRTMSYSTSLGLTAWLDKSTIYALGPLHPRQGSAAVNPYRLYDAWNDLHRAGQMTMRVQFDFTCFAERDDNAMLKEYLRNQLPFLGDDMWRTGGIGEWPAPAAAVDQTRAAQRLVAEARWRCDNDAANHDALQRVIEQLEAVNEQFDITSLRWNVNLLGTGVGWVTPDLLDRLHAIGCSIQVAANNWVNSRTSEVAGHAFRTIAAHPIRKSLFSNATHISPLNPWLHLYYVTTGLNPAGQQVNPGQQLTREEALRLRTRESSWFLRMEDRLGTIETGKLADLAVLDRDYFAVPDADIRKIRSVLTVVDGRLVHNGSDRR